MTATRGNKGLRPIQVYLPRKLHEKLKRLAVKKQTTMSNIIRNTLELVL